MAAQRQESPAPDPNVTWKWKEGRRSQVPAPVVGAELARIASLSGTTIDSLKPKTIVEAASSPGSPIHDCFEWRDDFAANRHRETQAGLILRTLILVRVEIIPGPILPPIRASVKLFPPVIPSETRAYSSVKLPETGRTFVPTVEAMRRPDLRSQLLEDAIVYLRQARAKYAHLEELREVFEAIERAASKLA